MSRRATRARVLSGRAARHAPLLWALLSILLSLQRLAPPDSDPEGFSTDRARAHLELLASAPRAPGTPHHERAKQYLRSELERLGYLVEIQASGAPPRVENVIARRAGTAGGRAILLASHYDSVPVGPGAADDGAAVAALLEVARLASERPHANDLVFLFSDAEERGLVGARAFVADHPWAADVGVALNFEARGASGPSIMFETSRGAGWLVDRFAESSPHPVTSSLSYEVYRRMPNDTDFTVFRGAGMAGLNFAFIGDDAHYHQPTDDLEHLDLRSLRHHAVQAAALVEALGDADLANVERPRELVYFDVLSLAVVRYPAAAAPWLAGSGSLLAALALAMGLRRRRLGVAGALGALLLLSATVLAVVLASWGLGALLGGLHLRGHADWVIALHVAVPVAVTFALAKAARWVAPHERAAAALVVWSALAVSSALNVSGASYLTAWPLLCSAAATFVGFWRGDGRSARLSRLAAIAVITFLWTPVVYLAFLGLPLEMAPLLAPLVALWWWVLPGPAPPVETPARRAVS